MNLTSLLSHPIFACGGNTSNFLAFPTWYEYLPSSTGPTCTPSLASLSDIWLIVAAVIEILLRIAAIMAVGFVIYGGIQYSTSQGSSERTNAAKSTLISAVVGLVICIVASVVVAFIAGSFK